RILVELLFFYLSCLTSEGNCWVFGDARLRLETWNIERMEMLSLNHPVHSVLRGRIIICGNHQSHHEIRRNHRHPTSFHPNRLHPHPPPPPPHPPPPTAPPPPHQNTPPPPPPPPPRRYHGLNH